MPQMPPHPTAINHPLHPSLRSAVPTFNFYFLIVIISALETFFFLYLWLIKIGWFLFGRGAWAGEILFSSLAAGSKAQSCEEELGQQ